MESTRHSLDDPGECIHNDIEEAVEESHCLVLVELYGRRVIVRKHRLNWIPEAEYGRVHDESDTDERKNSEEDELEIDDVAVEQSGEDQRNEYLGSRDHCESGRAQIFGAVDRRDEADACGEERLPASSPLNAILSRAAGSSEWME